MQVYTFVGDSKYVDLFSNLDGVFLALKFMQDEIRCLGYKIDKNSLSPIS